MFWTHKALNNSNQMNRMNSIKWPIRTRKSKEVLIYNPAYSDRPFVDWARVEGILKEKGLIK